MANRKHKKKRTIKKKLRRMKEKRLKNEMAIAKKDGGVA